ncbi:MAG: hypothetical protein LUE27_08315 [Clostridia bacterium]|nr:hypothetical protein [Clostridia bacterium]
MQEYETNIAVLFVGVFKIVVYRLTAKKLDAIMCAVIEKRAQRQGRRPEKPRGIAESHPEKGEILSNLESAPEGASHHNNDSLFRRKKAAGHEREG